MPSIAEDKKSGIPVTRQLYPTGVAGVKLSLTEIAKRIREGSRTPSVRAFVAQIIIHAGKPETVRARGQAILDYVRANVVYAYDPEMTEMTASAPILLCIPGAPMCMPIGDCFPKGTLLLRDDHAFVKVEELRAGERIWGKDKWTTVQRVWPKGKMTVDAVKMNNGSTMHLTPGHKVYVGLCKHGRTRCVTCFNKRESFIRIKVSELQEKDVLLQPETVAFGDGAPDLDRMYIEALALADGWTDDVHASFMIAGRDGKRKEAQKHEVKAICDRLGIKTHWHPRYIVVKDKAWAERIKSLGKRARFKHLETINLTKEAAAEALRGILADSTQNTQGGGRTYSTTSRKLMLQARVLLRMFGHRTGYSYLTPEQHGGAGKHPMWRLCIPGTLANRALIVKKVERAIRKVECFDITTEDRYVYLPEHDVTVSNCDDATVAIGSLMGAAGMTVRVAKLVISAGSQEHVLIEVYDDVSEKWIGADFSEMNSRNYPLGWEPTHESKQTMDPMHPDVTRISGWGTHEAEFIGVGSARLGVGAVRRRATQEEMGLRWDVFNKRWIGAASDVTALPADPYTKAQTNLANQVAAVVAAGDAYLAAQPPEYSAAVSAYQAAGNAGATSVGPEIDLAGRPAATQPLTQQAWLLNRGLAAMTPATADAAYAQSAQSTVKNMVLLYNQAIDAGRKSIASGGATDSSPPDWGAGETFAAIGVAGLVSGLLWKHFKGKKRSRR